MEKRIWCLTVTAEEGDYDLVCGVLALAVSFGWAEEVLPSGELLFRVHCERRDFLETVREAVAAAAPEARCVLDAAPARDWLSVWRQYFTPICCGSRFVVLPPWLAHDVDYPDRVKVIIEPKSAFGTGQHATTALCLEIISDLWDQGRFSTARTFLDLGTGSGILGIACCKIGLSGIGLDTDPLAVANALENRALNRAEGLEARAGSVAAVAGRHFDFVVANILARPLTELAPELSRARKDDGCLLLSGILATQADGVEAAYRSQGLGKARRRVEGEWCALLWE